MRHLTLDHLRVAHKAAKRWVAAVRSNKNATQWAADILDELMYVSKNAWIIDNGQPVYDAKNAAKILQSAKPGPRHALH